MVDKLYHRANLHSSFKPITHFAVEIQRFVCNRATPPIIEILWSKGIALHVYAVLHTMCEPEINYMALGGAKHVAMYMYGVLQTTPEPEIN